MKNEMIYEINAMCPCDQGIFFQPSGIPVDIKEHVIYGRYLTGGRRGGNFMESQSRPFTEEPPADRMKVLDIVLEKLCPGITYLQYKKIASMIHTNEETECEYYGNYSEFMIEYIILSELERYIDAL